MGGNVDMSLDLVGTGPSCPGCSPRLETYASHLSNGLAAKLLCGRNREVGVP